jgi:hypothetical protein
MRYCNKGSNPRCHYRLVPQITFDLTRGQGTVGVNETCWAMTPPSAVGVRASDCFAPEPLSVGTKAPWAGADPTLSTPNHALVGYYPASLAFFYRFELAGAKSMLGSLASLAPSIDGNVSLLTNRSTGSWRLQACETRDDFPTLDVNYISNSGRVTNLLREGQSAWPGPIALGGTFVSRCGNWRDA